MSRAPARFTEADVKRALAAAKKAGDEYGVEVLPDGTIRICRMPEPQGRPAVNGFPGDQNPLAHVRDFTL
jgi:hypothetical protein